MDMDEDGLTCSRCGATADSGMTTIKARTLRRLQPVSNSDSTAGYAHGRSRISWACQACGQENERIRQWPRHRTVTHP